MRRWFAIPRLGAWRPDMQSSDWTYYGLTYLGCFVTFTTLGIAVMSYIGPSEDAEKRRQNRRPLRVFNLSEACGR